MQNHLFYGNVRTVEITSRYTFDMRPIVMAACTINWLLSIQVFYSWQL